MGDVRASSVEPIAYDAAHVDEHFFVQCSLFFVSSVRAVGSYVQGMGSTCWGHMLFKAWGVPLLVRGCEACLPAYDAPNVDEHFFVQCSRFFGSSVRAVGSHVQGMGSASWDHMLFRAWAVPLQVRGCEACLRNMAFHVVPHDFC